MNDLESDTQFKLLNTSSINWRLKAPMPGWIEKLLASLYNAYYRILIIRGNSSDHNHGVSSVPTSDQQLFISAIELNDLDRLATRLGAAYRGIGVLIGILGAGIILCALLPIGLSLSNIAAHVVAVSKVGLMAALMLILLWARRSGLKEQWVALRRSAEYKRYESLREAIRNAKDVTNQSAIKALRVETDRIVGGGPDCQIAYNEKKHRDYEGIEAFGTRVTYLAFATSFLAAATHLILHVSWLIFLIAYLPAAVGAMHAVNSFLRLPQLVGQHGEMAHELRDIRQRMSMTTESLESRTEFLKLSMQLLFLLENSDENWLGIAAHQNLHPA